MPAAPRAALLAELSELLDSAAAGRGRVLVVSGEAGVGKTTLTRELAAGAGRVLWGACEPLAATRALLPLHDWARATGGALATALGSDETRHDVFGAVLDTLTEPTLAVVEDVHWADDATLDLLVFLGRRLADLPALLVLTVRVPEPASAGRVAEVLGHLATLPGTRTVAVPPLTPDEVAGLAGLAGAGVDARRLYELTGGNAFFVSELLAAPSGSPEGPGVPTSVREAVLARTVMLDATARALLETVAVIPDRAEADLVYAASGGGSQALEDCERAGLLHSDGQTVRFRHELAREAVEQALPGALRRARHEAVLAELLVEPDGHESRIAFHADHAGDHVAAVRFGLLAAADSSAVGAHRQAALQLERVRSHLDGGDAAVAVEVLRELSVEYQAAGPEASAVAVAEESVALARRAGDSDSLAHALAVLSRSRWLVGDGSGGTAAIIEAVEVGERAPGSTGQLVALVQASRLHMLRREFDLAVSLGRRALALADDRGDLRQHALAINAVGTSMIMRSEAGGVELMERGLHAALACGDDDNASLIMCNMGSGLGEIRRYPLADEWLERCRTFSAERDLDLTRDYARGWQARVRFELGDWDEALAIADELLDSSGRLARLGALTVLGRVEVRRGGRPTHLAGAWLLAAGMGEAQRTWPVAAGLAEAALGSGDPLPDQLLPTFADAVEHELSWAVGELGWLLVRAGLLTPDDARLASAATPYAAQIRGEWDEAAALWDGLGCRYEAALAHGERTDPDAVRRAVAVLDELGARQDADRVAARARGLDGARMRRPRRSTAANPFGLTDRELEVLGLLREGLTNAEIAERTYTSVKTTGHHVSSILAKLGVSSRREAARVVIPGPAAATDQ